MVILMVLLLLTVNCGVDSPIGSKNDINNYSEWSQEERVIADLLLEINPSMSPNKLHKDEADKRCLIQMNNYNISHDGVFLAFKVLIDNGYALPAEILGMGFNSPESVVKAWKNSEDHFKYMKNKDNKYFGVSRMVKDGTTYYCVLFSK